MVRLLVINLRTTVRTEPDRIILHIYIIIIIMYLDLVS